MSDRCPICSASDPTTLTARRNVPILMHRLYATPQLAMDAPLAVLDLVACRSCAFVWNRAFDPSKIEYDSSYENNQGYSEAFSKHLAERAEAILSSANNHGLTNYLEVGCGQGAFIERIISRAGTQLQSAEGFDPAWRGLDGGGPAGSRIHKMYFNSSTSNRLSHQPNIVVTRHAIEHVPDPVEFLTSIRNALGEESRATIYVETPDVRWIVENCAIQDFFYEHCSIFTAESLALALQRSGFERPEVENVFGGQYLWAKARAGARDDCQDISQKSCQLALEGRCGDFVAEWSERVLSARKKGAVALWGAGAKGVTFALLVDPDGSLLDHAIDINPQKQGHFLPGTALRVMSPETSAMRKPQTVFLMNPVYVSEILRSAKDAGIQADFVPIN
jgi:Methyltransferase domain/C-methyltransferase C-terminal domain